MSSQDSASSSDRVPFDYGIEASTGTAARFLICLPHMGTLATDASLQDYMQSDEVVRVYQRRVMSRLARHRSAVRYTLTHSECMSGHDIFSAVARTVLGLRIFADTVDKTRPTARVLAFVAPRVATVVAMANRLADECASHSVPYSASLDLRGVSTIVMHRGRTKVIFAKATAANAAAIGAQSTTIDTLVVHTPERLARADRDAVQRHLTDNAHFQLVLTAVRRPPPTKTRRRVKVRR